MPGVSDEDGDILAALLMGMGAIGIYQLLKHGQARAKPAAAEMARQHRGQAAQAWNRGDYFEAARSAIRSLQFAPGDPETLNGLAWALMMTGHPQYRLPALQAVNAAIAGATPDRRITYLQTRGELFWSSGEPDRGVLDFAEAAALARQTPAEAPALTRYAQALMARGNEADLAGAAASLTAAIAREPSPARWFDLGQVYLQRGDTENARRCFALIAGAEDPPVGSAERMILVAALVSLANVSRGREPDDVVWGYLARANALAPDNPYPLVGMAWMSAGREPAERVRGRYQAALDRISRPAHDDLITRLYAYALGDDGGDMLLDLLQGHRLISATDYSEGMARWKSRADERRKAMAKDEGGKSVGNVYAQNAVISLGDQANLTGVKQVSMAGGRPLELAEALAKLHAEINAADLPDYVSASADAELELLEKALDEPPGEARTGRLQHHLRQIMELVKRAEPALSAAAAVATLLGIPGLT